MRKKIFKKKVNLDMPLNNVGDGKTRAVVKYIKSLRPRDSWGSVKEKYFYAMISDILSCSSANQMLEKVGYEYKKDPKIYDIIERIPLK